MSAEFRGTRSYVAWDANLKGRLWLLGSQELGNQTITITASDDGFEAGRHVRPGVSDRIGVAVKDRTHGVV